MNFVYVYYICTDYIWKAAQEMGCFWGLEGLDIKRGKEKE